MDNKRLISGIIIVVLGVILLLSNLGYVDFTLLWRIIDIWPLLLVAIGFSIIFREKKKLLYITWILFIIIVIIYAVSIQNNDNSTANIYQNEASNVIMEKTQETQYGNLDLELGAAILTVNKDDHNLLMANINGRQLDYQEDYENNNELAKISFRGRNFNVRNFSSVEPSYYDFYLNEDVLWDLNLDLGALEGEFNLEDIPVRSIDLDFGAGDLEFILGDKSPELKFEINSGASSLNIVIPKEAGIKINIDSALSSTNIDELGLIRDGDEYISQDYENADIKIEFDIDMGIGEIKFNQ